MTLAVRALEAGPAAIANVRDLAYEVATLLTEGAPRRPRTRIAVEGIAGGLWNILYCEALAGRGHRLPLLSEYISYVVLTPYLGPEAAVGAIVARAPRQLRGAAGRERGGDCCRQRVQPRDQGRRQRGQCRDRTTAGSSATSNGQAASGNGTAPTGGRTARTTGVWPSAARRSA